MLSLMHSLPPTDHDFLFTDSTYDNFVPIKLCHIKKTDENNNSEYRSLDQYVQIV